MKKHIWSKSDVDKLIQAVRDCAPIFKHYTLQSKDYNESNAWDAVAGRLLPDVCVTGNACKKKWAEVKPSTGWDKTIEMVANYERDLQETTFDGVAELLGNTDAIIDMQKTILSEVLKIRKMWE